MTDPKPTTKEVPPTGRESTIRVLVEQQAGGDTVYRVLSISNRMEPAPGSLITQITAEDLIGDPNVTIIFFEKGTYDGA